MSVSGHKSVASVQSYALRMDDSEKLLIAEKLHKACVSNITDGNVQVAEEVEQVLDHFDVSEDCDVFSVSEDGIDELLTSLPEQSLMSFGTKLDAPNYNLQNQAFPFFSGCTVNNMVININTKWNVFDIFPKFCWDDNCFMFLALDRPNFSY